MDIFDLLFGWGGQAIQLTFQYGFILKEEDFLELTDEQYQKDAFLEAAKDIEKYCEGKDFHTDEEKLRFAARHMPDIFSKGSKYEKYSKFSVTKRQKGK